MSSGMVETFGGAVRAWRVSEGLSIRDLADLLKLTDVQVGHLERGTHSVELDRQWPRVMWDLDRLGFPGRRAS